MLPEIPGGIDFWDKAVMLVSVSIGYGSNLPELDPIETDKQRSITAFYVPNVWTMKHDCVVRMPGILMTCLPGLNASMRKSSIMSQPTGCQETTSAVAVGQGPCVIAILN